MSPRDWFRSETWNDEIEAAFETRLKRSREPFHRAQYLRIQAFHLLSSPDPVTRDAGAGLARRVIAEYPDERMQVAAAHQHLAHYFTKKEDWPAAERHLRQSIAVQLPNVESWAALELAELIIEQRWKSKYEEAWIHLASLHRGTRDVRFRIAVAQARLAILTERYTEATQSARQALELVALREPEFSRHPTVGRITADKATLEELRLIAAEGRAS